MWQLWILMARHVASSRAVQTCTMIGPHPRSEHLVHLFAEHWRL